MVKSVKLNNFVVKVKLYAKAKAAPQNLSTFFIFCRPQPSCQNFEKGVVAGPLITTKTIIPHNYDTTTTFKTP